MRRVRPLLAGVALGLAAGSCAPALRPPGTLTPAGAAPAPAVQEDPSTLLERAEESFARRPDVAAVRRADALFLAAAQADPKGVAGLVGSIRVKTWLAEHEQDAATRAALASGAVDAAQYCDQRAPGSPPCDYWFGVALGLQARERRSTAMDALKLMVEKLRHAAAGDERIDRAGPHRVLALVLLRAPAWPVGPGDPEQGLAEAKRAAALYPDFPPNQLALAEALEANGSRADARVAAERGTELARMRAAAGDPDAPRWIEDGEKLLARGG